MSRRTTVLTMAAAALALTALTACGSSGASDSAASAPSGSTPSASSSMPSMSSSMPSMPGSPSGDASGPSDGKSAPTGAEATITIKGFAYQGPASVAPGAVVTVVNLDKQNHTVTAKGDKVFDALATAGGGKATFKAPMKPGSYPYLCTFHGNMQGVLVVK